MDRDFQRSVRNDLAAKNYQDDKAYGFVRRLTEGHRLSENALRAFGRRLIGCAIDCIECHSEVPHNNSDQGVVTGRIVKQTARACFQLARQLVRSSLISAGAILNCEQQCAICAEHCATLSNAGFARALTSCLACTEVCKRLSKGASL